LYNGHATFEHWQVSSRIANIEGLYLLAVETVAQHGATQESAESFITLAEELGFDITDFTWVRVLAALEEYVEEEEE